MKLMVCLSEDNITFSDPQGTYGQNVCKTSAIEKRAKQQFKREYAKSRSTVMPM